MNYQMLRYIMGQIFKLTAALMGVPLMTALYYRDDGAVPILVVLLPLLFAGYVMTSRKPVRQTIYAREGFVIVAFAWILMSVFGALPFVISGDIPNFIDALFETVSGFTTTGSTLLPDVESMPMSLIMWRSFTHWIGGMGVLVFALALLPSGSAQSMYIMRAEVPGPSVGKLVAKTQLTARILYGIYIFFTVLEAGLLRLTGMRWFDCIANAFATAGTGGFSVLNSGIGGYGNVWVEIVITVFMLIFSINFNLFYMLLIRQFSEVLRNVEIKVFFGIYLTTTLLITRNIMPLYGGSFWRALRYAGFTTASLCSSTGFGTADFTLWPAFSQTILILLMFCGACAGSTGGGLKVARVMILVKSGVSEIRRQLNPRLISTVKLEGQVVENEQIRTQGAFFILYMIILLVSTLLLSMDRYGFDVSFSAALTALNNMGPGLGAIGPYGNFADFTPFSKLVIIFDMLVGRLEIFPILIAFMPRTWKKA